MYVDIYEMWEHPFCQMGCTGCSTASPLLLPGEKGRNVLGLDVLSHSRPLKACCSRRRAIVSSNGQKEVSDQVLLAWGRPSRGISCCKGPGPRARTAAGDSLDLAMQKKTIIQLCKLMPAVAGIVRAGSVKDMSESLCLLFGQSYICFSLHTAKYR